jgi:hypothetical protein
MSIVICVVAVALILLLFSFSKRHGIRLLGMDVTVIALA